MRTTTNEIKPGQTLEIRQHMDAIGQLFAERPADQWAGWLVYLLEVIENRQGIDERDFIGTLMDLQSDVELRLETGRWPNGEKHETAN